MAFWNKKSKAPNKAPTETSGRWLEDEIKRLERKIAKYHYPSSSTKPTSSSLYSGGTYGSPHLPPTPIAVDPMSSIVCKEGDSIVLKSLNQLPLYKLSKAELKHAALCAPKNTISIASLLLLFLEESEKLENND